MNQRLYLPHVTKVFYWFFINYYAFIFPLFITWLFMFNNKGEQSHADSFACLALSEI